MDAQDRRELYQQLILEHNKKPRNFGKLENATHTAEGYNPLCGDHLVVYVHVNKDNVIDGVKFEGDGCAISRSSASMMTSAVNGKDVKDVHRLFEEFHKMATGKLDPLKEEHHLGKLGIFSNIWHYPARVKCAILCWHALEGALNNRKTVTTE